MDTPKFSRLKKVKSDGWGDMKPNSKWPVTVSFNYDQLPEAKDWDVGDTYTVMIEMKQVSKNEHQAREDSDNHGGGSASFEILRIATEEDEEEDEDDEKDEDSDDESEDEDEGSDDEDDSEDEDDEED